MEQNNNHKHSLAEELAFLEDSSAWFDEVREAGPAMPPVSFPGMKTSRKAAINTSALDLKTGRIKESVDIIFAKPPDNESLPRRAYFIESDFKREPERPGHFWKMCRLVKPLSEDRPEHADVEWEIQAESMMVQCIAWGDPHYMSGSVACDEIAALQYIANQIGSHPNIRGVLDVLRDDTQWWVFTPVAAKEDLFSLVKMSVFNDATARFWFRQVLNAVVSLHKAGICHRNLGLEAVLIQEGKDVAILSDFEFSCRTPYAEDRSNDAVRRLMQLIDECGKGLYMAPEIRGGTTYDGHAADIWALGTMLYIMLTGSDPWNKAQRNDDVFTFIVVKGHLEEALAMKGCTTLDPEAIDLLKKIFHEDPRDRITLYELQHHPWVVRR